MAVRSKYIGKVYDGRWEVVKREHYGKCKGGSSRFVLRNIYNGMETTVKDTTLRKIDRGELTVSGVMSIKITKGKIKVIKRWN